MASPPYTDQAKLEARFTPERVAQLFSSQDAYGQSSTGVVNTTLLDATIVDASADFDEVVGTVFPMPLAQVAGAWDPAIVEIVSVFVMYRGADDLRPEYASGDDKRNNPYEKARRDALKRLEQIKSGQRRLVGNSPVPKNRGGEVTQGNPTNAQPFYFWPNPDDGTGGSSGF